MYSENIALINETLRKLFEYCQTNDWQGYDPYDCLNSRIFQSTPLRRNRHARLLLIQIGKRAPAFVRKVLLVKKGYNPKALALFVSSLIHMWQISGQEDFYLKLVLSKLERLKTLRSPNQPYYCWGYNFDWQSRTHFVPKGIPNIVCTTFVGNAFLDVYEICERVEFLEIAEQCARFLTNGLNLVRTKKGICFSYTPLDHLQVHNTNFLAAAFLSRVAKFTSGKGWLKLAREAVNFSISSQNSDGSWVYGTHPFHNWIDNFHTGFNLVALREYIANSGDRKFFQNLEKGYKFYRENLFLEDGRAKYYCNSIYPIDIHSIAQGIITFTRLKDMWDGSLDMAWKITFWSLQNMWDKRKGYFYFQKRKWFTNKSSFMRWGQAWMFYALSLLLLDSISISIKQKKEEVAWE
jgi:hypothetical protein